MRKRKPKLNFSSPEKQKKKRAAAFISAFAVFVVVLGGVSVLLFMDSIDFNLNNLIGKKTEEEMEDTTEEPVKTTAVEVQDSSVLLTIYSSQSKLTGLYMISSHADSKEITVQMLDLNTNVDGESFASHFKNSGMSGLKAAVESHVGYKTDRYIKQSETSLKKIIGKIGNVNILIPQRIQDKSQGNSLYLEAGEQSLTGDLFLKYLYYADGNEEEKAIAALVSSTLQSLYKTQKNNSVLSFIFNESETDFSIVDSAADGIIPMFVSLRGSVKA